MSDISKLSTELLEFKENHFEVVTDQTFITINNLVNKLYHTARQNKLWWFPPLINYSELDNAILLEWWNKKRKYSIYIAEDQITYIAVWGADTDNEMEEGDINIENDLTEFWEWIGE